MTKKTVYSWDATVFVAWIDEEETAPLATIDMVAGEIDSGDANLVVSVTAYSEVLEIKRGRDQMDKFRNFLKRSNVIVADNTVLIAEKAGRIRSDGLKDGRKIKTPDATFIATAIIYRADVFHTLDDQLLNLSGLDLVDKLKICKPAPLSGLFSFPSEAST